MVVVVRVGRLFLLSVQQHNIAQQIDPIDVQHTLRGCLGGMRGAPSSHVVILKVHFARACFARPVRMVANERGAGWFAIAARTFHHRAIRCARCRTVLELIPTTPTPIVIVLLLFLLLLLIVHLALGFLLPPAALQPLELVRFQLSAPLVLTREGGRFALHRRVRVTVLDQMLHQIGGRAER